ncbi:nucleotidyltransferase domain-containing protein [Streptomyces aidingensis]|nr:nucleotidyltransferase domain-containing protein [Streptomyces aidingensis]
MPDLAPVIEGYEHPLVFATVSGAHLYGFPSRDSDVDLRGAHLLPLRELVGLTEAPETVTRSWTHDGTELDLVTHDLRKFAGLLLRPNGYVLEQLLSPLVAHTSPVHTELSALAPRLFTRNHARHYRGFALGQRRLFERTGELKPLLYTFRVLLTGIRLLRTHELTAHLPTLLDEEAEAAVPGGPPAYLTELIGAKASAEHGLLAEVADAPGADRLGTDIDRLHAALDEAERRCTLPDHPAPATAAELNDLVIAARGVR